MSKSSSTNAMGPSEPTVTPPGLTSQGPPQRYPAYHTTNANWVLLKASSIYQRLRSSGEDRVLVKDWAGNLRAFHVLHDYERYHLLNELVHYLLSGQVHEHEPVHAFPEIYPLDFANIFAHHFKPMSTPDYKGVPEYLLLSTTPSGYTFIDSRRPTQHWSSSAAVYETNTRTVSQKLHESCVQTFSDEFFRRSMTRNWTEDRVEGNWVRISASVEKHDNRARVRRGERVQFDRSETNGMRDEVFLNVDDFGFGRPG